MPSFGRLKLYHRNKESRSTRPYTKLLLVLLAFNSSQWSQVLLRAKQIVLAVQCNTDVLQFTHSFKLICFPVYLRSPTVNTGKCIESISLYHCFLFTVHMFSIFLFHTSDTSKLNNVPFAHL